VVVVSNLHIVMSCLWGVSGGVMDISVCECVCVGVHARVNYMYNRTTVNILPSVVIHGVYMFCMQYYAINTQDIVTLKAGSSNMLRIENVSLWGTQYTYHQEYMIGE
jgi:hypothetical protein